MLPMSTRPSPRTDGQQAFRSNASSSPVRLARISMLRADFPSLY